MEIKKNRKHLFVFGAVLAGIVLFVMFMAFVNKFPLYLRDGIHNKLLGGTGGGSKSDHINHISFLPDGKKLLFDRSKGDSKVTLHVYDVTTGELSAYQAPQGENWTMGRYSYDGRHIVFVVTPLVCSTSKCENDYANMQIAIMDPDGQNVRAITNTPGVKIFPSFSHTGKKIIFAKAANIREKGARTPAADYDFFEVDVETGKETRLTYFRFFEVSPPSYLRDDKTFIFSAYGPKMVPILSESGEIILRDIFESNPGKIGGYKYESYQNKYTRDNIFKFRAGQRELEPYFFLGKAEPRKPLVTPDGKHLFFVAPGHKPDGKGEGYQLFRYSPDGKHQRVSHLDDTMQMIWSSAVSPDGELLATVGGGKETRRIGICRVEDGNCQVLSLPDQAATINQPR